MKNKIMASFSIKFYKDVKLLMSLIFLSLIYNKTTLANEGITTMYVAKTERSNKANKPVVVPAVSIAITSGSQVTIAGASITFTATPTNGGSTPTYVWKNNGTNIAGETNSTYTANNLANGVVITCVMTSSDVTASPTTATSNSIKMTVNALPTVNAVANQSACAGSMTAPVNFTLTGATSCTWTSNNTAIGLPANGTGNIAAFGATNSSGTPLTATVTATPIHDVFAYITNFNDDNVSVINTRTNSVIQTIAVGSLPISAASNADGSRIYVANNNSSNISIINTTTNTVIGTIIVPETPFNIVVSPDGSRLYVTHVGAQDVSVVNTMTNAVEATITNNSYNFGLNISPDGSRLYIINTLTNSINVINTATNLSLGTITVGSAPLGMAVSPDGRFLYVSNSGSNNISIINTTTNTVVATIAVGDTPLSVCISPNGDWVYVVNTNSDNVSVVNTVTQTVSATVAVGLGPNGISVNADGTRVYTTNSVSSNVSVINTTTNTVTATVTVGSSPSSLGNFVQAGQVNSVGTPQAFTFTVNTTVTPSVAIAASPSGAITAGTSVTFTATPTNGGTTPTYVWKKGGVAISGQTAATYTSTTLANGDVITCDMTSNATCASPTTATNTGITMTVNTPIRNGLNFDGVNDQVDCGNAANLQIATGTFEAWIKTSNAGSGVRGIVVKWYAFGLILQDNILVATNWSTGSPSTGINLADGKWHHVALSFQPTAGQSKVYVDGLPVLTIAAAWNIASNGGPLLIGESEPSGGSSFAGTIDGVRIWNTARTDAQIISDYTCQLTGSESGLVACYNFNQGVAASTNTGLTTLTDATIHANNGTLKNFALTGATSNWVAADIITEVTPSVSIAASPSGAITAGTSVTFTATAGAHKGAAPTYQWKKNGSDISGANSTTYSTSTLANGDIITCAFTNTGTCLSTTTVTSTGITMTVIPPKNGLNFDGVNDQVDCGNAANLQIATGTFEAWIKTSNAGSGNRGIVIKWYAFGLLLKDNILLATNWSTGSPSTGINLADGKWHHVALSFQPTAGQSKVYVDGLPVLTIAAAWNIASNGGPLLIGESEPSGGSSFAGTIDGVRIWNTARTDAQILSDYTCQLTGTESGLVACYNFNQGIAAGTNTGLTTLTDATANANNGTLKNFALTGATSNWVAADIITEVTPSVAIAASPSGAITTGTSVTFTATAGAHKGAVPTYQWKKNGTDISGANSATYATSTLANGNIITCTLTNTGTCLSTSAVTSTGITMTVNAVLPVELLDFKGTPSVSGNLLTWTTANEVNNKGFNVERLMDNGQWASLGFVNAKGKAVTYDFTDNTPLSAGSSLNSTSYYRLRQIDNDGKETLSKVISVERKGNNKLKAYPNPVSDLLIIETELTSDYQILNLLGQEVLRGKTARQIDVSALPQGTYFLKVGVEQVKFVKQ